MRNSKLRFEETVDCRLAAVGNTTFCLKPKAGVPNRDVSRLGRPYSLQPAFTLVEVLIVVAILTVVAAGLVGLSSYLQTQNNIALTEHCLEILSTAVAEFRDITGHYPLDNWNDSQNETYSRILGANAPDDDPSSDELLYLQLSLLPQTREIIANLPEKLLAAPLSGATVELRLDATTWVQTRYLRSIVDPWHTEDDPRPLDYLRDPDDPDDVFPRIWSSGPDGESNAADPATEVDDISNED